MGEADCLGPKKIKHIRTYSIVFNNVFDLVGVVYVSFSRFQFFTFQDFQISDIYQDATIVKFRLL